MIGTGGRQALEETITLQAASIIIRDCPRIGSPGASSWRRYRRGVGLMALPTAIPEG
jgi:hypothetical protein